MKEQPTPQDGTRLEIDMNPREVRCSICEAWTRYAWSVPTFNGDLVSNDFPDELWKSGGGGQPVCEYCYDAHAANKFPVFDRFYLHLVGGFIAGAGI